MDTRRYLELENDESHIIIDYLNDLRNQWLQENDITLIDVVENLLYKLNDDRDITITGREYCFLVNLLNKKRIDLTYKNEDTAYLEKLLMKVIDTPKQREIILNRDEAR